MRTVPITLPEGHAPGACISALFKLKGIQSARIAELLNTGEDTVCAILNGRRAISTVMAMKFEPVIAHTLNVVIEAEEIIQKQEIYNRVHDEQVAKARMAMIAAIQLPEHSLMSDRDAQSN